MHLTYRKNHGRLVENKKFSQVIENGIAEFDIGELEKVKALSRVSVRFTESLIDQLWKKGIINTEDVQNILKDIENVNPNAEIKVEL